MLTIDNQTVLMASVVLILFVIIGILIRRPSVQQSKQRQQQEWAQHGGAPEHGLIDDHASIGANIACVVCCAIGAYLACSILFHAPLFF